MTLDIWHERSLAPTLGVSLVGVIVSTIQTLIFNIPLIASSLTFLSAYSGLFVAWWNQRRSQFHDDLRELYSPLYDRVNEVLAQFDLVKNSDHLPLFDPKAFKGLQSSFRYQMMKPKTRKPLDELISLIERYDAGIGVASTIAGNVISKLIQEEYRMEGELLLWGVPKWGSRHRSQGPSSARCLVLGKDPISTFENLGSGYSVVGADIRATAGGATVKMDFPQDHTRFRDFWEKARRGAEANERITAARKLLGKIEKQAGAAKEALFKRIKRSRTF